MTAPTVVAVVVNYNAGDHLAECVQSLRADGVDEVVVVDNASVDGSIDRLRTRHPSTTVIAAGRNLGFGAAANLGAAGRDATYILVLNPDIVVEPGTVKSLVGVLEADPSVAIAGPRIEEPDGTLYPSARSFPSLGDAAGHAFLGLVWKNNPFTRRYRMQDWGHGSARLVDWVSGACFLARRTHFEELGGFDPGYFMYVEDVDLCWRAGRRGWGVAYEPAGRVTHVQGVSTARAPYRMIAAHHRSTLRFYRRTARGLARLATPAVAVALGVRLVIACGAQVFRR